MAKIRVVKIELSHVKTFKQSVELLGNERATIAEICYYLQYPETYQIDAISVLLSDGTWYKLASLGSALLEKTEAQYYISSVAKLISEVCAYFSGAMDCQKVEK